MIYEFSIFSNIPFPNSYKFETVINGKIISLQPRRVTKEEYLNLRPNSYNHNYDTPVLNGCKMFSDIEGYVAMFEIDVDKFTSESESNSSNIIQSLISKSESNSSGIARKLIYESNEESAKVTYGQLREKSTKVTYEQLRETLPEGHSFDNVELISDDRYIDEPINLNANRVFVDRGCSLRVGKQVKELIFEGPIIVSEGHNSIPVPLVNWFPEPRLIIHILQIIDIERGRRVFTFPLITRH